MCFEMTMILALVFGFTKNMSVGNAPAGEFRGITLYVGVSLGQKRAQVYIACKL
jgi:flagellar biogenesis protein FliO